MTLTFYDVFGNKLNYMIYDNNTFIYRNGTMCTIGPQIASGGGNLTIGSPTMTNIIKNYGV